MARLVPGRRNQTINDLRNIVDDFVGDNWLRRSLVGDSFKLDVEETDEEYIIHAELPGVQKDEVRVSMNEGTLVISVNKKEELEEEKKNYIHKERYEASMSREIYLADAKSKDIKAKLDQGVLEVTVKKEEKPDNSIKVDIE